MHFDWQGGGLAGHVAAGLRANNESLYRLLQRWYQREYTYKRPQQHRGRSAHQPTGESDTDTPTIDQVWSAGANANGGFLRILLQTLKNSPRDASCGGGRSRGFCHGAHRVF